MKTKKQGPHGEYCGCDPNGVYVSIRCPNPNRPLEVKSQTAVEWIVDQYIIGNCTVEVYEQARQMEANQIKNAYERGYFDGTYEFNSNVGKYIFETYGKD